jgi:CheY-like chemotaxis protein
MNGAQFLEELERKLPKFRKEIPIFVITAERDCNAQNLKVSGVLKKPLELEELLELAKRYH